MLFTGSSSSEKSEELDGSEIGVIQMVCLLKFSDFVFPFLPMGVIVRLGYTPWIPPYRKFW